MRPTSTAATGSGSATRTSARASSSSASGANSSCLAPVDADLIDMQEAGTRVLRALLVALLVPDEEDRGRLDSMATRQQQHPLRIRFHPPYVVASDDVGHALVQPVARENALHRSLTVQREHRHRP